MGSVSDGTRHPAGRLGRLAAVVVCLGALVSSACSGGGDDEEAGATTSGAPAPEPTSIATTTMSVAGSLALPGDVPCPENRHAVVIDIRLLFVEDGEVARWLTDPNYDPLVRAGALELVAAYAQRGYEVVYITGLDVTMTFGATTPAAEVLPNWLANHGFPVTNGASLHMWDPAEFPSADVFMTQVLTDLSTEDVQVDRVYTHDPEDIPPYLSGGIPADRIQTVGRAADVAGTTPVPNGDLAVHRSQTIDQQAPICAA